jgi:hypothetical protein
VSPRAAAPPPPQAPAGPGADLDVRLARLGPWRLALDLLGTAVLVGLLVLLPLATGRFGSTGFLAALALVFVLAGVTSTVAAAARRGLGLPRRPALAALSPFAASQAGERLLEHALATVPRLAAARALLPAAAFQAWLRVAVYDATEARDAPDAELEAFLTPALTTQILDPPDRPPGADRYCPRCGASYHTGEACCDCAEVRLVAFAS